MVKTSDLEKLKFFAALEPIDRDLLAEIATRKSYQAGETIFSEGDGSDSLRVLVSGLVSLRQRLKGAPGDAQMTKIDDSSAVFGIAALVGSEHVYPHSAVCVEATEVLELDGPKLIALLEEHPATGVRLLMSFGRFMAQRLSAAREQIRSRVRPGLISHG